MASIDRRLEKLEQITGATDIVLAIVDVVGMDADEAQPATDEKLRELEQAGWRGRPPLVIIDR